MSTDPVPQRISDADRDAAVEMLREHFELGRLTDDEFSERMAATLAARTAQDLEPLFVDLPQPHPTLLSAPSFTNPPAANRLPAQRREGGVPQRGRDWIAVAQALVWPAAIGLMILGRGGWWWILAAVAASMILGQLRGERRDPPSY